jgi:glycosyltransferase involved in cell wall biosynthesis
MESNNFKVVKIDTIDFEVLIDKAKKLLIKKPKSFPISLERFRREKNVLEKEEDFNKTEPLGVKLPHSAIFKDYLCEEYVPHAYEPSFGASKIAKALEKWYNFWGVEERKIKWDEELSSAIAIVEDILPEERKKSLIYKITKRRLKESLIGSERAHKSFIHGNLLFTHFRKDDSGNLYFTDFDFADDGWVEDDLSRFEVDETINSWKYETSPAEILNLLDKIKNSLEASEIVSKTATEKFNAINYYKRTPFTRYYIKEAEEDLFHNFLINAVNSLEGKLPITPPKPKREVRVLNISWGLPGGVNSYIQAYTRPLEMLGFSFVEIGYDNDDEGEKFSVRRGNKFLPATKEEIEKLLTQHFDIINIHNYIVGLKKNSNSFLEKLLKLRETNKSKIIYTAHGCLKEMFKRAYKIEKSPYIEAQEELLKCADKVIANSYLFRVFTQLYGSDISSKISVVEPSSDAVYYQPSETEVKKLRKTLKDDDTWLITYSGRITIDKGIKELVDSMEIVKGTIEPFGIKAKLLLIGPIDKEIAEYIKDKEYVTYIGEKDREEVLKYISASDINVQPTYYDSFNISILESLLVGKPVVTTDVSGPEHYFNHYVTRAVWSENYTDRVRNFSSALLYAMRNYKEVKKAALKGQRELLFKFHPINTAYQTGWNYLELLYRK